MTDAEELRAAAEKGRCLANAAAVLSGNHRWDQQRSDDAEERWCVLMDPALGLLLADWLEQTAHALEYWRTPIPDEALAVARAINKEAC